MLAWKVGIAPKLVVEVLGVRRFICRAPDAERLIHLTHEVLHPLTRAHDDLAVAAIPRLGHPPGCHGTCDVGPTLGLDHGTMVQDGSKHTLGLTVLLQEGGVAEDAIYAAFE